MSKALFMKTVNNLIDFKSNIKKFLFSRTIDKGFSKNTAKAYKKDLELVYEWLEKSKISFLDVKRSDIQLYIKLLKEKKFSSSSINRKISVLKNYYDFLKESELINFNPIKTINNHKVSKKLPRLLSEKEILKLIEEAKELYKKNPKKNFLYFRLQLVLEILYSTGLRISELLNLKIYQVANIEDKLYIKGKGDKQRLVVLNNSSLSLLRIWINLMFKNNKNKNSFLFEYFQKNTNVSRQKIYRDLKKLNYSKVSALSLKKINSQKLLL